MPWWRRSEKAARGQIVTPDGLPAKEGEAFADLQQLGGWLASAGVRVVDPGVPLSHYADLATAHHVWATQPSVRKVVDFIARAVSTIPLHVYERVSDTDRQRVTDHPLAELLAAPGPARTAARLWHGVLVDWLIYDRWCVQPLPSADTASGWELRRIPARRVHFIADDFDEVAALYLTDPGGRAREVSPKGFVFDHGYATVGADGTSPMETLQQVLAEARESVEWRRSVWRSGARVPAVIERPADAPAWSPTARARFAEAFNAFIGRGGGAGGTPILEDGMRLVPVNVFNPRDTGDIEGRQLADGEVASAFHIAPELVGARQGNYSNIEALRQMLYRDSLGPLIEQWTQVLNTMLRPLVPGTDGLYIEPNIEAKLRGSFEEQARVLQSSVGAPWLTRNEARARANLPAVDDGDQLVTPLNVVTGGLASPRDTAPDPADGSPKASGRPRVKSVRPDDLATFAVERDAFADRLTGWAKRQADGLLARADAKDGGPPDFHSLWAASSPERQAQLAALIAGHGLRLAQIGAWSVLDVWNPEADGWDAEVMEAWLMAAAESHAAQFEQAGYEAAVDAVRDEGDWQENLRDGMAAWVGAAAGRAVTAATEARSFGSYDAAGASGLTRKVWRTGGRNPRVSHRALDGESVALDDVFGNGLRWPGDGKGEAKETAHCNCSLDYTREG